MTLLLLKVILVTALVQASHAFLFDSRPTWGNLKVTWGLNPLNSFHSMPRTEDDAQSAGFTMVSDCDTSEDYPFRGKRYVKQNHWALVLMYDVNGFIAGMQLGVSGGMDNYPPSNLQPPFIRQGSHYFLTAYFVEPETICTTGRTRAQFNRQGTGTMLRIQNGPQPATDHIIAPFRQSDIANTQWVEGKCFYTMGMHYWYNITKDMNCDDFFPVFLLYNRLRLNGFGWAVGTSLDSPFTEHPAPGVYSRFMKEPPTCLYNSTSAFSTMHIFLSSYPRLNLC